MRITKFGHSCLFIEEGEARILIDPGSYVFKDVALKPEDLPQCNVLLLTHEHPDHTDPAALKTIYELGIMNHESGVILTNAGVQKVLKVQEQQEQQEQLSVEILKPGEERVVHGVTI